MADPCLPAGPKKSFKRSGIKAFTEAKVTPVVLVCIYNQSSTLITHDLLYSAFTPYGKILRILIFEKLKVWKAFVEFDNLDSAFEAKRDLNDFLLFNDGTRMNVYYSNLDTINFQNSNAGGKDYTLQEYESNDLNGEEGQGIDPEAYLMGQEQEAASLYAGSNLSPHKLNHYGNSGSQAYPYPQELPTQVIKNRSSFDEKDDEILKIINDHQEKSKEPQSISEEEKLDGEDQDKDLFAQYFTNTFQPKVVKPASPFKPNRSKTTLSLKSAAFGVQASSPWQQSVHEPVQKEGTPPGLSCYDRSSPTMMFPKQKEQPKLFGYSNSYNQIPKVTMPTTATKATSQANSPLRPGMIPKTTGISNFHSMHSIPTNFGPPFHQILNNPPEGMAQYPAIVRTDSRSSFSHQSESISAELNPVSNFDGIGYEDMVEMIEQDIRQNYSGLMNSSNASHFNDSRIGGLLQQNFGNMDVSSLSNMSLSTLSHLYNELSVLLGKADNMRKSPVLYVKGLESSEIQISMLYNIFSNFGNIIKIYFMKNKASAFIEFENSEYSSAAKDSLNDVVFMGTSLQIYYSNGSIPNLNDNQTPNDPWEEVFVGNSKNFRFKKNKNVSINPPSATLHLSNLTREACNEELIKRCFSPYGRIEGTRFMFVDNKNMCLLKMSSIEESMRAMAYLHDKEFGGRNMQISFTRSKL